MTEPEKSIPESEVSQTVEHHSGTLIMNGSANEPPVPEPED